MGSYGIPFGILWNPFGDHREVLLGTFRALLGSYLMVVIVVTRGQEERILKTASVVGTNNCIRSFSL